MKGCDELLGLQDTLKALADPIRREILNLLKGGRLSAGEICEHFSVTGASISRHLAILKDADLIRSKNSEFVALLKQANTDISKISEDCYRFVTNSQSGMGLLKCGNVVIPFDNQIERIRAFIYLFYSLSDIFSEMAHTIENSIDLNSLKLQQVGAEISENQKLHQAGAEIEFPAIFGFVPWRHHVEIVTKCKTIEEALFYVRKTIEESWSRSTLVDCIKANLYQSSGNALTNFAEKLPAIQGKLAQEIVKDTYDFGFVSLPIGYDEEELEDALEQNITRFLLELGSGFAFIGRQKEIIVAGKTRKIDMLFYHIRGSVGFSGNRNTYGSCNLR